MNFSQSFHTLSQVLAYGPAAIVALVVLVVVGGLAWRVLSAGYHTARQPLPEFRPSGYRPAGRGRTAW